jgi:acetylornithine/succinyldiaminopimelate/putrescine aminotransferase
VDHEEVRPDIVILGKALSGGLYPVSRQSIIIIDSLSTVSVKKLCLNVISVIN